MVRWYHAIFSAYGFWLPNDPRGSWSTFVGAYELYRYGAATKTDERRSLAHDPHDFAHRREAKQALKFPPVRFHEPQRDAIAAGMAQACHEAGIVVHACAIGHDHVHVVTARHSQSIENVVGRFKGRATQALKARHCHPMAQQIAPGKPLPSPWAEGSWSVFINDDQQLRATIAYVERHPTKEGLPFQRLPFITPV